MMGERRVMQEALFYGFQPRASVEPLRTSRSDGDRRALDVVRMSPFRHALRSVCGQPKKLWRVFSVRFTAIALRAYTVY